MGTRLYPNTDNAAIIEKLAGVKPGTMAKLDAYNNTPFVLLYERTYRVVSEWPCRNADGWVMELNGQVITYKGVMEFKKSLMLTPCGNRVWIDEAMQTDERYIRYLECEHKRLIPTAYGYTGRGRNELGVLENFLTYGWGRVAYPLSEDEQGCGSTDNPIRINDMLDWQNVSLPKGVSIQDLGGLSWS